MNQKTISAEDILHKLSQHLALGADNLPEIKALVDLWKSTHYFKSAEFLVALAHAVKTSTVSTHEVRTALVKDIEQLSSDFITGVITESEAAKAYKKLDRRAAPFWSAR